MSLLKKMAVMFFAGICTGLLLFTIEYITPTGFNVYMDIKQIVIYFIVTSLIPAFIVGKRWYEKIILFIIVSHTAVISYFLSMFWYMSSWES